MAACCCLCRDLVLDQRRKKKLHGAGCTTAKSVMREVLSVPLEAFVETRDATAVLCYKCERTLNSIHSLSTKIESLKTDVRAKGSTLQRVVLSAEKLPKPSSEMEVETQLPIEQTHMEYAPSTSASVQQSFQLPLVSNSSQVAPSEGQSQVASSSAAAEPAGQGPSPRVQVNIPYKSGVRTYNIATPSRKRLIKRITRKAYRSMASAMNSSPRMSKPIVAEIATKIKSEMKDVSSDAHDSILRDSIEAVKHFHWETVMLELQRNMPTLMSLLSQLVREPAKEKPLLCFMASQLLKARHQHMGLVQRAVSVMMYGNGTAKQVFANLQPLGVCMSYQGTMNIVDKISEDHDVEVQMWADELANLIEKPLETMDTQQTSSSSMQHSLLPDIDIDGSDEDATRSPDAPIYSPISFAGDDAPPCESMIEDSSVQDEQYPQCGPTEPESYDPNIPSTSECMSPTSSMWFGYKFVGDNIDKNVKPSLQRHELRGQSLHHFHGYAVRDRVNLVGLSNKPPPSCTPDPNVIIPSQSDLLSLTEEFEILVSRIIVQHMDKFKSQASTVPRHIPSRYSKEMASKSIVVPLGVLLHDENKLDDMAKILSHYMKLVPTVEVEGHLQLPNGSIIDYDDTRFFSILFGGDQLTVACIRGTQILRDTQSKRVDRFEGILPVVEDWHSRMTLMKVIWGRLYSQKSNKEKGTMFHFRNLINRTTIPSDPEKNMNAAEDFMLLLLHTHVVAAAKVIRSFSQGDTISDLAKLIVSNYVHLPRIDDENVDKCDDGVHLYAIELVSLGLLWHGFHDAIREGDGERVLRYWKVMIVVFKSTNHRNYAKEAVNMLLQYYYTFSEREKAQLLWSRFINTRGFPGANIPCDLFMEHLN